MARQRFTGPATETGNALFLVLIAIILFAALSYAITQSDRGGGMARRETNDIEAARLIEFAGTLSAATTRLRVAHGCDDNELSFENPVVTGYANATAPASKKCHYFDAAGAGEGWTEGWFYTGQNAVNGVGLGTDTELLAVAAVRDLPTCLAVNRKFGLPADDEASLGEDFVGTYKFDGTYPTGNILVDDGGNAVPFTGAHDACVKVVAGHESDTDSKYFYYHVLVER